jgi:hypothetical protein
MAAAVDETSVYDKFVADFGAAAAPTDEQVGEKSAKNITEAQWELVIAYAQPRLDVYGTLAKVARVAYRMDPSTLKARVIAGNSSPTAFGPPPVLGRDGEKLVADYVYGCSKNGLTQSKYAVQETLKEYVAVVKATHPHLADRPLGGRTWFRAFLKRNPTLSARTPELRETSRMMAMNKAAIARYVGICNAVFETVPLDMDLLVMDEKCLGLSKTKSPRKGSIGIKGQPCQSPTTACGQHVSVVGMKMYGCNKWLMPAFIHSGKRGLASLMAGVPDKGDPIFNYRLMMSDSGYMETGNMLAYTELMIKLLKPSVLMMDSYSSHRDLRVLDAFKRAGWHVIFFTPHTTDYCCFLDVSEFRPFQAAYEKEMNAARSGDGGPPARDRVASLAAAAFEATGVEGVKNLKKSWKGVGVVKLPNGRFSMLSDFIPESAYAPAEALFAAADEAAAAAGVNEPHRPSQLALSPEQITTLKEGILKPKHLPAAALSAVFETVATGKKGRPKLMAELGTGAEFMEKELAKLEKKKEEVDAVAARKAVRLAKKDAKGAGAAPRKGGKQKRAAREEEEEEDAEDEADDDDEEEDEEEDVPELEEEGFTISAVRGHEWRGTGKARTVYFRVKWDHLDEAKSASVPLEPLKAYEWTDTDSKRGCNTLVFAYINSTAMTAAERKILGY